ncbi:hypothetical protein [Rhizohabitans arisaemae]|uniref:hypothetical protein n=1 Tax=Rhizohabitans arisaemae TaxID=2720610 RepID=UPI0024B08A2D|nr:hypothetical protein [Rhizohabitans arisaemae]
MSADDRPAPGRQAAAKPQAAMKPQAAAKPQGGGGPPFGPAPGGGARRQGGAVSPPDAGRPPGGGDPPKNASPGNGGKPPDAAEPPRGGKQAEEREPAKTPGGERHGADELRNRLRGARSIRPGGAGRSRGVVRETFDRLNPRFEGSSVWANQVFAGDQVLNLGVEKEGARKYRLSAEELDEAAAAFVPPPGFESLVEESTREVMVLLRGPAGAGKFAAARRVLLERGHRPIYRLDSATSPSRLTRDDLEQGAGYILPDLLGRDGAALTEFEVRRLHHDLEARRCGLVVTVGDATRVADPEVAKRLRDLGGPADRAEVARRQARWRAGIVGAGRIEDLLADSALTALLAAELGPGVSCARAAELGRMIAEIRGPVSEAAGRLTDLLAMRQADTFDHWLDTFPDLATQCLAVSLAVFGGEAYETVAELADGLRVRLEPPEHPERPERVRSAPLRATRARRLEALRAELVEVKEDGQPRTAVYYRDQGAAERVLRRFWDEYDEIRAVLPAWLRSCAEHAPPNVVVRSAVAAGLLAIRVFDMVGAEVLRPWAESGDESLTGAVGVALHTAASDAGLAGEVRRLVDEWRGRPEPGFRAAAVRAWRVVLDSEGVTGVLDLLNTLADDEDDEVLEAVCVGVMECLVEEDERQRRDVLALLIRWARSREPRYRLTGELAFLCAALGLVDVSAADAPDAPVGVPTLLVLASRDPLRQRDVAVLWEVVMNSPFCHGFAGEVLAGWGRCAEGNPAVRRALGRLLAAAAGAERTERIIRYQVDSWSRKEFGGGAPSAAREVLTALDGRRRER